MCVCVRVELALLLSKALTLPPSLSLSLQSTYLGWDILNINIWATRKDTILEALILGTYCTAASMGFF